MLDESSGQVMVGVGMQANERTGSSNRAGEPGSTDEVPPPEQSGYTREFWLIFAATFALNSAANLFVMLPVFVVRLGGGATTIGEVVAIGSFAALIMRPAASAAIDHYGCRRTALWSAGLDCAFIAFYVAVHSLGWPLYAVRALQGAAEGTARVALFALVYEILPPGRLGEVMATFSLSGMLPAAFGALLGETIMRAWGFSWFFCAGAFLCMVALITIHNLRGAPTPAVAAGTRQPAAPASLGYRGLLTMSPLITLWLVTLLFGLSNSARTSFLAPFAYQRGIHTVGWYFTIYALAAVVVRLSGRMLDRVGLETTLAPAFAVLGVGIALIAGAGHPGLLDVAAVLGGIGHGIAYPVLCALVIRETPDGATGRSSALYTSVWDVSAMAGPYLLGLTAHYFGYSPMFVVAGTLPLIASAVLFANESEAAIAAPEGVAS